METLRVLKVAAVKPQPSDKGYYSLMLEEVGGNRRMQIVIGAAEAHSIDCVLRKIVTPRPLSHDLMADIIGKFHLRAEGVIIELLPGNIYGARLMLTDGTNRQTIDARSSDAVALAVRLNIPIYASSSLLDNESTKIKGNPINGKEKIWTQESGENKKDYNLNIDFSGMSNDELQNQLKDAANDERYEMASLIKAELDRRKKNNIQ